jgi:magnesium-transporting ATPase (P-type)
MSSPRRGSGSSVWPSAPCRRMPVSYRPEDVRDLTFLGLVGMIDPPREPAKAPIAACHRAGIQVKMITGDHAVTASAIAAELGLHGQRDAQGRLRAVTGRELEKVDPESFRRSPRRSRCSRESRPSRSSF